MEDGDTGGTSTKIRPAAGGCGHGDVRSSRRDRHAGGGGGAGLRWSGELAAPRPGADGQVRAAAPGARADERLTALSLDDDSAPVTVSVVDGPAATCQQLYHRHTQRGPKMRLLWFVLLLQPMPATARINVVRRPC